MKKILVIAVWLLGVAFLMSGCEGSGKTQHYEPSVPTLHFDTEGEYDLSKYLFPKEAQVNIYELTVYHDSTGERHYTDDESNTSYYSLKYQSDEEDKINESEDDLLKRVFEVKGDRILETDAEDNRTKEIVRHIDIGEYAIIYTFSSDEGGQHRALEMVCKVSAHLEQYQENENVLKISCDTNESKSLTFEGSTIVTKKQGTYVVWLAKEIGIIRSTKDICSKTTDDDGYLKTRCQKENVKLLTTANI